jgi:ATP-dependent DNA helicase RecG
VQNVSIRGKIAREIVSNSLAHREYDTTVPARIIIERDRIYADNWNRSLTYGKLDPKNFSPQPKNPIIAQFFENIGYADKLGSGVRNLYHYTPIWANGALPELIDEEIFKTIVPLPESFRIESGEVFASYDRVTDEVTDEVTDRVTDRVTDDEQTMVGLLRKNNQYTLNELAKILSVSRKTVTIRIKRLKEKGVIERVGSDRSGYWKIVE